jgi:hypothetical protein
MVALCQHSDIVQWRWISLTYFRACSSAGFVVIVYPDILKSLHPAVYLLVT